MSNALDNLIGLKQLRDDSGDPVVSRQDWEFKGDGVSLADNPATQRTEITVLTGALSVLCTQLNALVGTANKQQITVSGYASVSDGGGGTFVWDSSSTATVNNGTIFGGANPGRWLRVYPGALNAKWFGATGNGSDNDLAAIQSAVSALGNGAALLFPAGTYYLGTRTGAADAQFQLSLQGLSDIELISEGAKITFQTTSQTLGYAPIVWRLQDCARVRFRGSWTLEDTKSWSTYASYGQGTTNVPNGWSGLSGMHAIAIYERCTDISFGDLTFINTRYGVSVLWEDALPSSESDRSKRITIDAIHADDCQYPFLLAENGDDVTAVVKTVNCLRPVFMYGMKNANIIAHVKNSLPGFQSVVARKKIDTENVKLDMSYASIDGYPYTPLAITATATTSYGDPYIRSVDVRLRVSSIVTSVATRERQACVQLVAYDASDVETTFTALSPGGLDGVTLDVDQGKFEFAVDCSPLGNYAVQKKLPIKLIRRDSAGGTYRVGPRVPSSTDYGFAKKIGFSEPTIYEHNASDIVHAASYVYPISGWSPWVDASLVAITTAATATWKWVRIGAWVEYELTLKMIVAAASLPAGAWYFRPPYFPVFGSGGVPPRQEMGDVYVYDDSTGDTYHGRLAYNGSSGYATARMRMKDAAGTQTLLTAADLTKASPFTMTTDDVIRITCRYLIDSAY